jgi:acyl-coenzyme A synthetase/AMP-(fatty) acid ligase
VQERRITIISAIPSVLRLLLALPGAGEAFARVRGIFTASESVLRSDIDAWRRVLPADCGIALAYGLTEGSPLSDWFVPREFPGTEARLPVGYPIAWHEFAIADAAGQPVRDGEVGELWVRGRLLSLGEWRQGRCSPGRLLADSDDPSRLVLRTGDLVRLRPDGLMEFVGRTDAMVKIRGNRVELAEIEDVIRRIPGVADVAIIPHQSDAETTVVAFVVLKKSDPDGLRRSLVERLRALLPAYMVPARIEFLDALPRLSGGKIDSRALATAGSRPERRSGSFGGLGRLWARRS